MAVYQTDMQHETFTVELNFIDFALNSGRHFDKVSGVVKYTVA